MSNEENVTTVADDKPEGEIKEETAIAQEPEAHAAPAENNEETAEKKAPAKAKVKSAKKPTGMSKFFKLVYYPLLAVFAVIMLVFSLIDGAYGYKPRAYGDKYYTSVNAHVEQLAAIDRSAMSGANSASGYIVSALKKGKFTEAPQEKSGEDSDDPVTTVTGWVKDASKISLPTVTVMTSVPSAELQRDMGLDVYTVGHSVTNVIAAIPSKHTRANDAALDDADKVSVDAVIIAVRYDARPDTPGAASNASFVATAIESLTDYVNRDVAFEKDLIVVFTEELDSSFGSYTFFKSFKGLDDVVSRAKVGLTLDAFGNSGTLALTDASKAGFDYLDKYNRISGTVFNSSLVRDNIPQNYKISGAVDAFGDVPVLQVAVLGGLDANGSLSDTAADMGGELVYQQSAFFKAYVDRFAATDIAVKADGIENQSFFSYFDWGSVAYTDVAAYVIGAIIIALIAGAIAVMAVKKVFSVKKMFRAMGMELLVAACTLVAMFAAYFLVTLMLTGFGVLPINAIVNLRYTNGGILVAAMLVALASTFGFTTVYKKLFKVTSSDTVRGTALMFAVVGAVISFAAPAYSYIVSWLGLTFAATLLMTACLNGKLKNKYGFGFDQLFIFVIPTALCMPLTMSGIAMLSELLPLYLLPVVMLLFTGMLGVIVPYLDRTQPALDRFAKKLPPRTQRVQRTVIERVEDRAKKGKFTEREVTRIEKEKIPVNYKNYFGVSLIAVIGIVVALLSGGFGATMGQNIVPLQSYDNAIYNDSLVYEWDRKGADAATHRLVINDLMAYKYMRYAIDGLEWDAVHGYYYKNLSYSTTDVINREPQATMSSDNNTSTYTFTTFDGSHSVVIVTIPSASSVTEITVDSDKSGTDENEYVYTFENQGKIVLRLPYGFCNGVFTLNIKGGSPREIQYEEHRVVSISDKSNMLSNIDDWNSVLSLYRGKDVLDNLRGGIVLKREFSL